MAQAKTWAAFDVHVSGVVAAVLERDSGELWVQRLTQAEATRAEAQEALDRWFVRTMNIFGRPESTKNQIYRRLKLKLRDNDEVRQAFASEVKDLCEKFGLTVPEWKPVWDKLPEEAHIPG